MRLNRFAIYDELPLWSAPFGMTLLEQVRMRRNINILDIGSGGGFPMLELAERFGKSCKVWGLDPSGDSLEMISEKIKVREISNATLINGVAETIPFSDGYFSLVTANNGLNNVADEKLSLAECSRVLAEGGQFVMTVNLPGTFAAFYDIFRKVLMESGMESEISGIDKHIFKKRKPVSYWEGLIGSSGFSIDKVIEKSFSYRFSDAGAFLDHYFIRTAFAGAWKEIAGDNIIPGRVVEKMSMIYGDDEIIMEVPYVCFDCFKK